MLTENSIIRKRRGRAKSGKCSNVNSEPVIKAAYSTNPTQRVKQFAQSELGPQLMTHERQTVDMRVISRQRKKSSKHAVGPPDPPKYSGPPQVRCKKLWGQSQRVVNTGQPSSPRFPPGLSTTFVSEPAGDSMKNGLNQNERAVDTWHQPTPSTNCVWNTAIYSSASFGNFSAPVSPSNNQVIATRLDNLCLAYGSGTPSTQSDELVMRCHRLSPPGFPATPTVGVPSTVVDVTPGANKSHMGIFSKIDGGMFFICNEETEKEVFDLKLFALPQEYLAVMQKVTENTALFLYRKSHTNPVIYGVFLRDGPATLNIVESAFGKRYPAQIRFKEFYRFPALPEHLLFKEERYQYYPGQSKKLFRVQPQYGSLISKAEIHSIINQIYINRLNLAAE